MAHRNAGSGSGGWRDFRDTKMPSGFPSRTESGSGGTAKPTSGSPAQSSNNGLIAGESYDWDKKEDQSRRPTREGSSKNPYERMVPSGKRKTYRF